MFGIQLFLPNASSFLNQPRCPHQAPQDHYAPKGPEIARFFELFLTNFTGAPRPVHGFTPRSGPVGPSWGETGCTARPGRLEARFLRAFGTRFGPPYYALVTVEPARDARGKLLVLRIKVNV